MLLSQINDFGLRSKGFKDRVAIFGNAYCVLRHEVALTSCSQLAKREPSVPPGDARSLNKERL